MSERAKLDKFIKQMKEGIPYAEDYIDKSSDIFDNALEARDLSENALAREVLKNTGIPIPGKGSTRTQTEDFLNKIVEERYPELKPNVKIDGNQSFYQDGKINLSDYRAKNSPEDAVGTVLHEAGHQYDDKILNSSGQPISNKELRLAKAKGLDLKNMDPMQVYEELVGVKHHAKIPKLREGTYGFGALKSLLKSGTFKGLAPVGVGAALAGSADEALADVVIPGGAESLGKDSDKQMEDDTPQVKMMAESATDHNVKRMALQELKNRLK